MAQPTIEELRADLIAAQARSDQLDADLARDLERGVYIRTPAGKARRLKMDALKHRIGHLHYEIRARVEGRSPPTFGCSDVTAPKV